MKVIDALNARFDMIVAALQAALNVAKQHNLGIVANRLLASLKRIAAARIFVPSTPGGLTIVAFRSFLAAAGMRVGAERFDLAVTKEYAAIAGCAELIDLLVEAESAFEMK